MDSDPETESSVGSDAGPLGAVGNWVSLEGDRRLVAAGIVAVLVVAFSGLLAAGVLAVGAGSAVATVFGSGLTAGVVTLVTIALSINQLILSRVFGSPDELRTRLEGTRELRHRVEDHAGLPSSSNDPATFLAVLADTLHERATAAAELVAEDDAELPASFAETLHDVADYGQSIDELVDPETPVVDVLGVVVGPEYAINMRAVHHLQERHGSSIPSSIQVELTVIEELLESVAVVRQFFKTIALQQDFGSLSRMLVYSGLAALLVSVSLTLVYGTESVTLSQPVLHVVVPLAFGVVSTPFALFGAYILRAATVAYRTVSVGPFIPPGER